jgi:hypothetical protein
MCHHPVAIMIKRCTPAKGELCVLVALEDAAMDSYGIAFIFYFSI